MKGNTSASDIDYNSIVEVTLNHRSKYSLSGNSVVSDPRLVLPSIERLVGFFLESDAHSIRIDAPALDYYAEPLRIKRAYIEQLRQLD